MRGMFRCSCIELLNEHVVLTRLRLLHVRFEPAQRVLAGACERWQDWGISGMECQD